MFLRISQWRITRNTALRNDHLKRNSNHHYGISMHYLQITRHTTALPMDVFHARTRLAVSTLPWTKNSAERFLTSDPNSVLGRHAKKGTPERSGTNEE